MKLYTHAQIDRSLGDIPPAERFDIVNRGITSATDEELYALSRKLPRRNGKPRDRGAVLIELEPAARDRLDALRKRSPDASMSALFYRLLAAHGGATRDETFQ